MLQGAAWEQAVPIPAGDAHSASMTFGAAVAVDCVPIALTTRTIAAPARAIHEPVRKQCDPTQLKRCRIVLRILSNDLRVRGRGCRFVLVNFIWISDQYYRAGEPEFFRNSICPKADGDESAINRKRRPGASTGLHRTATGRNSFLSQKLRLASRLVIP